MSMVRAMRMLNSVEAGTTDASALQTLLADAGRLSEWAAMLSMRGQVERMVSSQATMNAVCGSSRAIGALLANPRASAVLYHKDYLPLVAPNAWAVYAPRLDQFELSGTGGNEVARWRNALGLTTRDLVQGTSANRPLLNGTDSPALGIPTLQFDGSNDVLDAGEAFSQAAAYTVFVVYRRGNTNQHGLFGNSSASQGLGADGASTPRYDGGSAGDFSNNAGASGAWALGRYRRQSAALLYHSLNGGSDSAAITSNIPDFATTNAKVGAAGLSSGQRYLNGRIAEVWLLAGNGDASTPELQRITNLLKNKYGL